jgi:hypothetical protein
MKKPKPQSTQAFSLVQHHLKFLETPILMKTNKDQRQKYTLMKIYDKA